ncbi:hypothetical protein EJ02DRAFT_343443, partial [Clathrospora elynae]
EEAIGKGNDVVIAPHSWSCIIAGSAFAGLGKKGWEAGGKGGGVIRAAYIAAFILPEGMSLVDVIQHDIPDCWDGPHVDPHDPKIFYNDLPEAEQKYWLSHIESHSLATWYSKTTAAFWKEIPTSYLLCEDDVCIPAVGQDMITHGVKEMGGEIEVTRIRSGHSHFLSKPGETVNWIRRVAGGDF